MNYKFQYDRKFKYKINDYIWECYLITDEEFIELDTTYGEDSIDESDNAMILIKEQCLFITEGNVNKGTIAHELLHIFVEYFRIDSANLGIAEFEEIIASFLQHDGDKFMRIRNKLYKKYKTLEGAK